MKRLLISIALVLPLSACDTSSLTTTTTQGEITPNTPTSVIIPDGVSTNIVRVVDGDTAVVTGNVKVRFLEVNSPESVDPNKPVECFGPEASAFTKQLLPPGTAVTLVYDQGRQDRYGRDLAYVYRASDNLFVNAELVQDGYARVLIVGANKAHEDEMLRLQSEAQTAKRGLWGAC